MFAASGPTVTLSGWTTFVVGTAAVCTALTVIAVFAVKFTRNIVRPAIVLAEIAAHFGEGYQETITGELQVLSEHSERMASNQGRIVERLDALTTKVDTVSDKLSETRHDIIGNFAMLKLGGDATVSIVEALERTAAKLNDVDARLAQLPPPATP